MLKKIGIQKVPKISKIGLTRMKMHGMIFTAQHSTAQHSTAQHSTAQHAN